MGRRSKSYGSSRVSPDRIVGVLLVIVIGIGGFLAAGYALAGRLSLSMLLIVIGAVWLSAIAILNGATKRPIYGVEPQTSLIALGLAILLFPDPLAIIFLLAALFCGYFWSRRGFRL